MTDEIQSQQTQQYWWTISTDSLSVGGMARTGSEHGAKLEDVQRTVGHANPSTKQIYDRRRFLPTKSAALMVAYERRAESE
jgi:hypothetical protein